MTAPALPRLLSAFHCRSPEARTVAPHVHVHHELVFILSGKLSITTPQGRVAGVAGDLQIFPAGTDHDQRCAGPWHTICAQFSAPLPALVRTIALGCASMTRVWMEQLADIADARSQQQEIQDALLCAVLAQLRSRDREASFQASLHPLLAQATQLLSERWDRDLDATAFARELAVSPGYLASLFRARFGCSVMKYHHGLRMERARALLSNPYQTARAVSRELGFRDLNYFIRRFREFHGVSPGRWRLQSPRPGSHRASLPGVTA